jgi:hypothetical protein
VLAAPSPIAAAETAVIADQPTLRDFMVQNVCVDAGGAVLIGQSPAESDSACIGQRDLRPGEPLPYHKHDHPSPDQRAAAPLGYQRHDSFPVETAGFGIVVEHSFDFGVGEGRRFGAFDQGSDGGDVAILSPGTVSIGATRDQRGFEFWIGECRGPVTAAALARSWLVAEYDPQHPGPLEGATTAHLNQVTAAQGSTCPGRFSPAYTSWHVAPFRYRAAPGQGTPVTLTTLISDHYGAADPATADHVERFYFTRELGGTRWERWQNAHGDRQYSAAQIAERAAWFASTGRCSAAPLPAGGAEMVLIDCREWTRIVPPADPAGDRPGFFIDAIRALPDAPTLFAASARDK